MKKELLLPFVSKKKRERALHRAVLVVEKEGALFLRKARRGEIMEDLFEFPYFDCERKKVSRRRVVLWAWSDLGLSLQEISSLPLEKQSFTSLRVTLFPFLAFCDQDLKKNHSYEWISKSKLEQLSFSSGHRRILQRIMGKR